MGILDPFTGDAAKDASEENARRWDEFKRDSDILAYRGLMGSIGAADAAKGYLTPLQALGTKYGTGTNMYMNSLGLHGAAGNQAAVDAFQTGPGYEFAVNQSLDALDRRAASRGMLASGNTSLDTLNTVTGLANQEYGNWQNRLAGFMQPELSATGAAATGLAGLEAGKANYWQNDATRRINAYQATTGGLNDAANQRANAEMQSGANLFNLGQSFVKMGTGFLG